MLFSHREVADDIAARFEPVWLSLRPVPQVTIDFGDGNVVRRTLHGNIATWICDAEGRALDVIPGAYTTTVYRERLAQAALLAEFVRRAGDGGAQRLRDYHAAQAARMAERLAPRRLVERRRPEVYLSKFRIENPLEIVLDDGVAAVQTFSTLGSPNALNGLRLAADLTATAKGAIEGRIEHAIVPDATKREAEAAPYVAARPVADDSLLAEDVKLNETERRAAVHRLLAETGPVAPGTLTKRLYREVLHCDLDDPWLGLGKLLFESYPFER